MSESMKALAALPGDVRRALTLVVTIVGLVGAGLGGTLTTALSGSGKSLEQMQTQFNATQEALTETNRIMQQNVRDLRRDVTGLFCIYHAVSQDRPGYECEVLLSPDARDLLRNFRNSGGFGPASTSMGSGG